MTHKKKQEKANSIPVHFADEAPETQEEPKGLGGEPVDDASIDYASTSESKNADADETEGSKYESVEEDNDDEIPEHLELANERASDLQDSEPLEGNEDSAAAHENKTAAGPMLAELLATRSELRRVETERNDLLERLARRQADFENYRKRVERERAETYQRMVGDVVSKLLPVMDNMRRALQAESILEKNESAEFRHFLRGVELIYKQLNDALHELGVEAVPAVGQPFDPHVHEAVATEHSDEYEPDTVTQELLRGYRLGEKLLRPAMVKVSTRQ